MKKKIKKILSVAGKILLLAFIAGMIFPTWTPKIPGTNSISELRQIKINGAPLEIMIRGNNRDNPVIIFVHGGPCCSEIPYVRKYQDLLEEKFTIVHYDQRGSGKSYRFGKDYADITAANHVEDLVALTGYIEQYLQKEQVILIGHSYGTYIAAMAAAGNPELYSAYIGIGQMSDTINSELDSLQRCIAAAESEGNTKDAVYLSGLQESIEQGVRITPRQYVRKYGFAARGIDENADYWKGFLAGSEYNLLDTIRFYAALFQYQEGLTMEVLTNPITDIVTEIDIPVYFVMGKYDGMTSPESAKDYLNTLKGKGPHQLVIFEQSAHYPQFEEKQTFYDWMCETFIQ